MKLARVESNGLSRLVIVLEDELVDLTDHLGVRPPDISTFLAMGSEAGALARRCIASATPRLPRTSVIFKAPITVADKILGVGMNYHSFVAAAQRVGLPIPPTRLWFYRPRGCIAGPYDDVWLPRGATDFDYEAELAVVIGRRCRHVKFDEAPSVVAGFMIANDLTLRENVAKSIVLAKSFDTHTPIGPWLVTTEEVGDPHGLTMRTWVNGELRQEGNTSDMIATCYELIVDITSACTLNPGDVILTGTPDGSGIFRQPPAKLAARDVVRIEIDGIGVIQNRVIEEPALDVHTG